MEIISFCIKAKSLKKPFCFMRWIGEDETWNMVSFVVCEKRKSMASKIKVSLSLKLSLIVVFVSAIILFSLTYINLLGQASFFEKNYSEKALVLARSIDASIGTLDELQNNQTLQRYILNLSRDNPEIRELSITTRYPEGLRVLVSSNETRIGSPADQYNTLSYESNAIIYIPVHQGNSHTITVIAPVNISGRIVGTYDMVWSMDRAYAAFDVQTRDLIAMSVISLFVLIFISLLLLRRAIVKPIVVFRNAAKLIGEGHLDEIIKISSRDELGELAAAFNQMAADLKKSRMQIEKYNKTLEGLLDQKDEFITQLGHDLKSPLTPLVGLLPLVADREKDPVLKEHLQVIIQNVEYMRDLILKTLQLAKLRSPDTTLDLEPLNILTEVATVLSNQQHLFQQNNITVENTIPGDIVVQADKLRFAELLNNLLTNAVKYTPPGGGRVTLGVTLDDQFVTVSVKDTGIGMNKKQLEQVFDEFYKISQSRQELDSSGLGLSICKRIVEKHGGRIWAKSPGSGLGSTFFFTLPVVYKK